MIVGPDIGPNCLPRLSADDTGKQKVNASDTVCLLLEKCNPYYFDWLKHVCDIVSKLRKWLVRKVKTQIGWSFNQSDQSLC